MNSEYKEKPPQNEIPPEFPRTSLQDIEATIKYSLRGEKRKVGETTPYEQDKAIVEQSLELLRSFGFQIDASVITYEVVQQMKERMAELEQATAEIPAEYKAEVVAMITQAAKDHNYPRLFSFFERNRSFLKLASVLMIVVGLLTSCAAIVPNPVEAATSTPAPTTAIKSGETPTKEAPTLVKTPTTSPATVERKPTATATPEATATPIPVATESKIDASTAVFFRVTGEGVNIRQVPITGPVITRAHEGATYKGSTSKEAQQVEGWHAIEIGDPADATGKKTIVAYVSAGYTEQLTPAEVAEIVGDQTGTGGGGLAEPTVDALPTQAQKLVPVEEKTPEASVAGETESVSELTRQSLWELVPEELRETVSKLEWDGDSSCWRIDKDYCYIPLRTEPFGKKMTIEDGKVLLRKDSALVNPEGGNSLIIGLQEDEEAFVKDYSFIRSPETAAALAKLNPFNLDMVVIICKPVTQSDLGSHPPNIPLNVDAEYANVEQYFRAFDNQTSAQVKLIYSKDANGVRKLKKAIVFMSQAKEGLLPLQNEPTYVDAVIFEYLLHSQAVVQFLVEPPLEGGWVENYLNINGKDGIIKQMGKKFAELYVSAGKISPLFKGISNKLSN